MYEQDRRPLIDFARILLVDPPQRLDLLKSFLAANPEFAPGYYELSQEYSAARKGTQSLGDKQAELQALERFKALDAQGKLVRYFMDQTAVAAWLDDADKRLKSLALLKQSGGGAAPALSAMRSNTDWMITLTFREIPKEVFYKLEGDDSFRSLGFMEYVNPGTGLKTPKTFFNLRPTAGKTMMEVKYTDIGDETRGPFTLVFDPAAELLSSHKKVLDQTKNGWLQFAANGDKVLLHFSQLASWRCAIDKVAYGIDTDATPSTFPLEPCDPKNPNVVKGRTYIEVPAQTRYASVRVTYKDGTRSETVRIER